MIHDHSTHRQSAGTIHTLHNINKRKIYSKSKAIKGKFIQQISHSGWQHMPVMRVRLTYLK